MILVDTSAWVESLRDTGSAVCNEVARLIARDVAVCDPIRMEVMAGARDEAHLDGLRALLARAANLGSEPDDHDVAASLYRTCRRRGETVRKLVDCLIGAVAIRHGVPILHADTDFTTLTRHTALTVHAARDRRR